MLMAMVSWRCGDHVRDRHNCPIYKSGFKPAPKDIVVHLHPNDKGDCFVDDHGTRYPIYRDKNIFPYILVCPD